MDFISTNAPPSPTYSLHARSRFKRPVKAARAPLHRQPAYARQPCKKEPHEAAIEALQRSMAALLATLDRIETKVDLLADKVD